MNREQFDSLPVKEQRVWMCRDVIARLDAKQIEEMRESYLILPSYEYGTDSDIIYDLGKTSAQKLFQKETCHVCAKGALVYDWVINFNQYTLGRVHNVRVIDEIINIFPCTLRDMMEYLFEGDNINENPDIPSRPLRDREVWSIRDIMQNIIDNGGVLIYESKRYGDD